MAAVILALCGIVLFLSATYFVVKSAINNSELLKEIKVLLMDSQNSGNKRY
ncbi:MAG: hypothetical protein QHH06_05095 [Clostridiales bacterium]|jgi:hypothetical protein|nr:hypothetical protein [Eubacteriales bacterium]MDH7565844.1 hypothetical protein [Clostridiales bacterium]